VKEITKGENKNGDVVSYRQVTVRGERRGRMYHTPTTNYQLIRIQIFNDDIPLSFPSQVGLTIELITNGPCNTDWRDTFTKKVPTW
jgi:hypothetical protein